MNVLVTGGAGYIGSHTVWELKDAGYDVVVYDNLSRGHIEAIDGFTFVEGNILDYQLLVRVMREHNISAVVHFAAESQVGESMENPQKYYQTNVVGTLSLLKAMKDAGVNTMVFSSTAAIYGEPEEIPITEDLPKNPTNVYGRTKFMIEQILQDFDASYGIKSVCLRYFNAAGAHPSGKIGEDHTPETHLIPIIMQVILGKRPHLYVFGKDYPTHDGTCIRDYIHVCDLATAHVLALRKLQEDKRSDFFNLGNGRGFSVKEVIDTVEKVTGKKVPVVDAPRRKGDPAVLVASSEKIRKILGWQPKYPSLESIIETAWKWHKTHPEGYAKSS